MKMLKIWTMLIVLLAAFEVRAASVYVRDIKVEGLERVEVETVLSYVDIKKNTIIDDAKMDASLKQLYATGLFNDVSLNMKNDGLLIIKVAENPIINKVLFDGNDKVDDEMLKGELQLAPRSTYSRAKVQEDVQRILEIYKRTGRYAVVVEPQIIERDQNRVDLIFKIDEGPLASINKVNFVGNKHYSDDDLQSEIMSKESRWYRIFSSAENYDSEKTNYDKELLRRFYFKRGYADFRVVSAVAELSPDKKSFVLTFVLTLLLGIFCAWKEGSLCDRLICRVGTITSCIPEFWLSLMLILIFAVELHWLPSSGAYTIGKKNDIGDRILHLILPMSIVVLDHLWYYAYMIRNKILEEVRTDYVLLAKSKGLNRKKILFGHCLRNVIPTYLSLMAISVPHVLGGTYIIESVFSYPGIGTLSYESARYGDYNLLMVLCIFSGILVIFCNMIAQTINERIDPRIRAEEAMKDTKGDEENA